MSQGFPDWLGKMVRPALQLPATRYPLPATAPSALDSGRSPSILLDLDSRPSVFSYRCFSFKKIGSPQVLGEEEVLFGLWHEQFQFAPIRSNSLQFTPLLFSISKLSFNFVYFSVISGWK